MKMRNCFRKSIIVFMLVSLIVSLAIPFQVSASPGENLALSATASANGVIDHFVAARANDGDPETDWATPDNFDDSPSFTLDWNTAQSMNYIIIKTRDPAGNPGGFHDAKIEFFAQGGTLVKTVTLPEDLLIGSELVKGVRFDTISGVYSLKFSSSQSDAYAGFKEFEVYNTDDQNPNLAFYASPVASSSYNNTDLSFRSAVDGNEATEWASAGGMDSEEYLALRWSTPQTINRVVLKSRGWSGNEFKDVSLAFLDQNGTVFKTFAVHSSLVGGTVAPMSFDTVEGVYALAFIAANANAVGTSGLREIEVYDVPAGNLALDATAAATSEASLSHLAANAIDGKQSTEWATLPNASAPSLTINWAAPQSINYIVMKTRDPGLTPFPGGFPDGKLEFFDADNTLIQTVNLIPGLLMGKEMTKFVKFDTINNVYAVKFSSTNSIAYPGFKEIEVYNTPDTDIDLAGSASASASSFYNDTYHYLNATDRNDSTEWASAGGADAMEWYALKWNTPQTMNKIIIKPRLWGGNECSDVSLVFLDQSDAVIETIAINSSLLGAATIPVGFEAIDGIYSVKLYMTNVQGTSGLRDLSVYYDNTARQNLALLAEASANSYVGDGFVAANTNDGDMKTEWATAPGAVTPEYTLSWVTPQSMNYVVIKTRDPGTGVTLGGFPDGKLEFFDLAGNILETVILAPDLLIGANLIKYVKFDKVDGVYALKFSSTVSILYPGFKEFEVYNTQQMERNLANYASVSASSSYNDGLNYLNAVDGNDATEWASAGAAEAEEWYKLTFASAQTLNRVTLKSRTWLDNRFSDVKLELLAQNGDVIKTINVSSQLEGNTSVRMDFATTDNVYAILFSATNVEGTSGLREIEANFVGDVNNDGSLDSEDLVEIKRYLLGLSLISATEDDMIGSGENGKVSLQDLVIMKRIFVSQ